MCTVYGLKWRVEVYKSKALSGLQFSKIWDNSSVVSESKVGPHFNGIWQEFIAPNDVALEL